MARKQSPTKKELAHFKALSDLGLTNHAIAIKTKRDPKTVKTWLQSPAYNDPEIASMVDLIKTREINDLYLIGAKARSHIHKLLDEGNMKAIETVATMDRSFQQRRLLQGESTDNIAQVHQMVAMLKGRKPEQKE